MDAKKKKILLVDDVTFMRKKTVEHLLKLGIAPNNIYEAVNGKSALQILESLSLINAQVDLIISDWKMPQMSGLEFLQLLRSSDLHKTTPFMLVTTESDKGQIIKAAQYNIATYMVKPYDEKIFSTKIIEILGL